CEIKEFDDKIEGGIKFKNGIELYWGQVTINTYLQGYTEYNERNDDVVNRVYYDQNLNKRYKTQSTWLELNANNGVFECTHTVEHLIRRALPFVIPCDPYDIGGHTQEIKKNDTVRLWIYDTIKGGIGISYRLKNVLGDVLETGCKIASSCRKCKNGCPLCIQIKRCLLGNEKLDKKGGLTLAKQIIDASKGKIKHLNIEKYKWE
ncbi:MAG TPA: DUF1998 domain-containing protein, partial [Firmicutes bacterium]|nr:DUF1998 domain-containing protein [Bacillota bacterium]